jgi:AraC-like DNA-binding protein
MGILNPKSLLFLLFLCCNAFGQILFESAFEYGPTLLQKDYTPSQKSITLYQADGLSDWQPLNGRGWIRVKAPPYWLAFKYRSRQENVLSGIASLSGHHPEFTEVKTAGFRGWHDVPDKGISIESPGLHGNAAVRIDFTGGKAFRFMQAMFEPVAEYFGRFYIRFSKDITVKPDSNKTQWIFETLSDKTGILRIGVVYRRGKPVFCLRFHRSNDPVYFRNHTNIWLKGKSPIVSQKPYCVEWYFAGNRKKDGGVKLWTNGNLEAESFGHFTGGRGLTSRINFGSFSHAKFDKGHMILDDITISTRRIGLIPAIDSAVLLGSGKFELISGHQITHLVFQSANEQTPWFLSRFNSGKLNRAFDFTPILTSEGKALSVVRLKGQNNYGNWSDWITPSISYSWKQDTVEQESMFKDLWLADTAGNRISGLVPNTWALLNIKLENKTQFKKGSKILILLTHYKNIETAFLNNGHPFREKTGYFFRIDPLLKLFWCRNFDGAPSLYEVSGQKHTYVDAKRNNFKVDLKNHLISFKFRLSGKALIGPWKMAARVEGLKGRSADIIKVFSVNNEMTAPKQTMPFYSLLAIVFAFVVLLAIAILVVRTKRFKAAQLKDIVKPDADVAIDLLNPLIKQCLEIIEKDYRKSDLTIVNLAKQMGISRSHLSGQFKKETGKSFPQHLNEIRMAEAKKLLKSTELQVSEIAYTVGYGTYEHFMAHFKNVENMTPGEFRKKHSSP